MIAVSLEFYVRLAPATQANRVVQGFVGEKVPLEVLDEFLVTIVGYRDAVQATAALDDPIDGATRAR